jgi:hypothetical protein
MPAILRRCGGGLRARCGTARGVQRLGLEAGLADGGQRLGQRGIVRGDGHGALAEPEAQRLHTRDGFERAADLGLFDRAVHGRNAEQLRALGHVADVSDVSDVGYQRDRAVAARAAAAGVGGVRVGVNTVVAVVVLIAVRMGVRVRRGLLQGVLVRHAVDWKP